MTTLTERTKIELDATGDPAERIAAGSTQGEIAAAVALLAKLRAGVIKAATDAIPAGGNIPVSGIDRDKIAWGRDVIASPDSWARLILRVLLARFDMLTPAQIVGVTDQSILTAINASVPALAVGRDVRR